VLKERAVLLAAKRVYGAKRRENLWQEEKQKEGLLVEGRQLAVVNHDAKKLRAEENHQREGRLREGRLHEGSQPPESDLLLLKRLHEPALQISAREVLLLERLQRPAEGRQPGEGNPSEGRLREGVSHLREGRLREGVESSGESHLSGGESHAEGRHDARL